MKRYEHIMAKGKTLEELSESMTKIANIRNMEIEELLKSGKDVVANEHEWFKPVGELNQWVDGTFYQVMRRII